MAEKSDPNLSEGIEIVELNDSTKQIIAGFECDFAELKNFLEEDALPQAKQSVNKTYLWLSGRDRQFVAYLTVCVDAIVLGARMRTKMSKKGVNYKSLPALKIGRLAVRKGFTRRGLGKRMLAFVTGLCLSINSKAACRFITVDSKNYSDARGSNPVDFYLRNGFSPVKEIKGRSVPMYKDLIDAIM